MKEMNKIAVPINDEIRNILAVNQLWQLLRIDEIDGVSTAIFIEAAAKQPLLFTAPPAPQNAPEQKPMFSEPRA